MIKYYNRTISESGKSILYNDNVDVKYTLFFTSSYKWLTIFSLVGCQNEFLK